MMNTNNYGMAINSRSNNGDGKANPEPNKITYPIDNTSLSRSK